MSINYSSEDYYGDLKNRGLYKRTYDSDSGLITYTGYLLKLKQNIASEVLDLLSGPDTVRISSSMITPHSVLKTSGHIDNFTEEYRVCTGCRSRWNSKEERCPSCDSVLKREDSPSNEMFELSGRDLFLRPQTCVPLFTNYSYFAYHNKRNEALGLLQRGYSFRNELSSNKKLLRLKEFEQIELELCIRPGRREDKRPVLSEEPFELSILDGGRMGGVILSDLSKKTEFSSDLIPPYFEYYMSRICGWLTKQGLRWYLIHIPKKELPHYGTCAFDLMVDTGEAVHQISTVCDRGRYDLLAHSAISPEEQTSVLEFSLGLDRIVYSIMKRILQKKFDLLSRLNPYAVVVVDTRNTLAPVKRALLITIPFVEVIQSRNQIKRINRDLIGTEIEISDEGHITYDMTRVHTTQMSLILRILE